MDRLNDSTETEPLYELSFILSSRREITFSRSVVILLVAFITESFNLSFLPKSSVLNLIDVGTFPPALPESANIFGACRISDLVMDSFENRPDLKSFERSSRTPTAGSLFGLSTDTWSMT